jgi:hypothetical protein
LTSWVALGSWTPAREEGSRVARMAREMAWRILLAVYEGGLAKNVSVGACLVDTVVR